MISFKEYLTEVKLLDNLRKDNKLGDDSTGKHIKNFPDHKHIGTMKNGDHIYHHSNEDGTLQHYLAVNPKTKRANISLKTSKLHHSHVGEEVDSVTANRQSKGAHHLYHHLITKHDKILHSREQSHGGRNIWKKLGKMKGIHIHGYHEDQEYDHETGSAHHLDPHDDEHYVKRNDIHKSGLDSFDDPEHDLKNHAKDAEDMERSRDMHIVAHRK